MNCFSRVVICPILYAPKYCDDRLPPGNNYLTKVFEVNAWIHRFNETNSGIPMHLDSQGLVAVPTCSSDGVRHDYSKWREPTWNRMLHMGKEAQESAAQQLLQVFDILEAIQGKLRLSKYDHFRCSQLMLKAKKFL